MITALLIILAILNLALVLIAYRCNRLLVIMIEQNTGRPIAKVEKLAEPNLQVHSRGDADEAWIERLNNKKIVDGVI